MIVRDEFATFRKELDGTLAKMEARITAAVVHAVAPRLAAVELAQKVIEAKAINHDERISRLEQIIRQTADTSMLPPPPEAA